MFVDTDLLCIGALFPERGYNGSARRRSAASTLPTAGIFGDFDAAHRLDRPLSRARRGHVTMMEGHRAEFEALAEKVTSAATIFMKRDEVNGSELDSAGRDII